MGAALLAIGAIGGSTLLNHEVTKRLATVPSPTSTTNASVAATTTIASAAPAAPRGTTSRGGRNASTTTTLAPVASSTTVEPTPETPSEIITALDKLEVADEHSRDGKNGRFGYWRDDDHDGCNTRDEVLIAESTATVERTPSCRIISGQWLSPYDDVVSNNPSDMAIDHVVTITEAWESGAWQWTDQQRNNYLNDLEHPDFLVAVSNTVKDAKADKDPGEWLPPAEKYRCSYLGAWVHLKSVYKLTVDPGEREAIAGAALHC